MLSVVSESAVLNPSWRFGGSILSQSLLASMRARLPGAEPYGRDGVRAGSGVAVSPRPSRRVKATTDLGAYQFHPPITHPSDGEKRTDPIV